MAVYEQVYRPYAGPLTAERGRFAVLTRFAFAEVFRSRILTAFYTLSFAPTLIGALWIYLHHNVTALAALDLEAGALGSIDAGFFLQLLSKQAFFFGGVLAIFVGPPLISADLANGALPLYFSRPLSRAEYVSGKLAVLVVLLSTVSLVPGIALYALQAFLGGKAWIVEQARLALAIPVGCAIWVVAVSLLVLAVSTIARRRIVAQAYLFGVVIAGSAVGNAVRFQFDAPWGLVFNLPEVMRSLWGQLYGVDLEAALHPAVAWAALAAWCAAALLILWKRLQAYEVVR